MECIVRVAQGSMRGKECQAYNGRKYYSFEGIPYAKPPVGKLRFRDPGPPENWSGILDATKPGQKCAQINFGTNALEGSEDCLYLNVYTPSLPDEKIEKLPVIFFVHGGRFLSGYGDYYRPDYFLQNDVVLVTINYRLHILGFLCLHIPEVPGNAACKDTIMALKWVKNNIKHLNGDENNVTAFGESAGSALITSYVTSKMADNLVHKIIAQSGVAIADLYLLTDKDPIEKAKQIASSLGQELNDAKSLYDFLKDAPLEDLINATMKAEISKPLYVANSFFRPVIEKKFDGVAIFYEEYPFVVFKENRYKKLPILVGLSGHEGALFLRKDHEGNIEYMRDIQRLIPRFSHIPYNSEKSRKLANSLKSFYFKNKEINDTTKTEYIDLISDAYFNRDILMFAEYYSKYCDTIYVYYFCYSGNMHTRTLKSLGLKGAAHGDIIPYEFYRKTKAKLADDNDENMINFLCEAWSNFARNGKPTWSNQQVDWPKYNQRDRQCLNIGQELSAGACPLWPRTNFWVQLLGERSKL